MPVDREILILSGPNKQSLVESLLYNNDDSSNTIDFIGIDIQGKQELHVIVSVDNIGLPRNERGTYCIQGTAALSHTRPYEMLADHVPVDIKFSVLLGKGVAHVQLP